MVPSKNDNKRKLVILPIKGVYLFFSVNHYVIYLYNLPVLQRTRVSNCIYLYCLVFLQFILYRIYKSITNIWIRNLPQFQKINKHLIVILYADSNYNKLQLTLICYKVG
jgi:TRAP-type uncharacterized transport system fused permease subunit